MKRDTGIPWLSIVVMFLTGGLATAMVPQVVPVLGAIAKTFHVAGTSLGWIVSFPTLACAVGALAFGVVVDRMGDIRLLLLGMLVTVLGDVGVSLAPALHGLFAARLFQGLGYVCITVAAPTFIQRVAPPGSRRAAMAFWAAHTPVGFAAAVYFGAQLAATGFSWRWSFFGHALVAIVLAVAVMAMARTPSAADVHRSAGTWRVLTSIRAYAVALGALSAAMFQVSVMTLLPSLLAEGRGLSGQQSAQVVVIAMLANWLGAMAIVTTAARKAPFIALPLTAAAAAFFGFATVAGLAPDRSTAIAFVMVFCAAIGAANSLIWSLLPAAVPAPEASGATAGLVTQGSFVGVLFGPPIFFWIRHQNPALMATLALILVGLMLVSLIAHRRTAQLAPA